VMRNVQYMTHWNAVDLSYSSLLAETCLCMGKKRHAEGNLPSVGGVFIACK